MQDEGPDDIDADLAGEGEATLACPACGNVVWEEAEQCPACGHWISQAERARGGGGWPRVLGIVVIVVVIVALVLSQL